MTGATQKIPTMCPMNCHPTLCGMVAEVGDGKLVKITGNKDHPDSQGFLCVRGQAAAEIIGNPKRVLKPMVRDRRNDASWREVDWDQALDFITSRLRIAGRERTAIWAGHGILANNYGLASSGQLLARFANLYGCQSWVPAMICWGMGGFGLGLTGALEVNTKEDISANSNLIIMWGANFPSQPNTTRHVRAAQKRGAQLVTIDVRRTEVAAQSDDVFLIKPGSDAALALAMMHVIIAEGLVDADFIAQHTIGFTELRDHVADLTPEWAATETGIPADRITALAHDYANSQPAAIIMGGSSIHKGANAWQSARAISCLPALVGGYGVAGSGLGERHGARAHGAGFQSITADDQRKPGTYVPSQMSEITESLDDGRVKALLLFGSNFISSFADATRVAGALDKLDLVVCHDLFMNETARRHADVVLPATAWLEDVGCKATHTHVYLAEKVLEAEGEARPVQDVVRDLANRLDVDDVYPWSSQEEMLDTVLDHPGTGYATIADLRKNGGMAPMNISHVAYPTHAFATPSGKIEFYSERARSVGLPPLPSHSDIVTDGDAYPLALGTGRTLTQFHAFYDHGQALPLLAKRDPGGILWLSPADAMARGLGDGDAIRIFNHRGAFDAKAHVTDQIPSGVVWMRDGVAGLNNVTSGDKVLPDNALDFFYFTVGSAKFAANVEVTKG